MKIEIRNLKLEDIPYLREIDEKITHKKRDIFWEDKVKSYIERDAGGCLVAEVENKIAGFLIGGIQEWQFGLEKGGWIEIVEVSPEYMGRGVGKKLGKAILNHFKKEGVSAVYTLVPWDYGDLLSFFKTLGFERGDLINLTKKLR